MRVYADVASMVEGSAVFDSVASGVVSVVDDS